MKTNEPCACTRNIFGVLHKCICIQVGACWYFDVLAKDWHMNCRLLWGHCLLHCRNRIGRLLGHELCSGWWLYFLALSCMASLEFRKSEASMVDEKEICILPCSTCPMVRHPPLVSLGVVVVVDHNSHFDHVGDTVAPQQEGVTEAA